MCLPVVVGSKRQQQVGERETKVFFTPYFVGLVFV